MKKIILTISIFLISFMIIGCQAEVVLEPLDTPTNLRIEGHYVMWDHVTNAFNGYVVSVNDGLIERTTNLLNLSDQNVQNLLNLGTNTIKVKAKSVSLFAESPFSEPLIYTISQTPEALTISGPTSVPMNSETTYQGVITPVQTTGEILWSTSDETIATIGSDGKLSALALGTVVVTAVLKDTTITHSMSVTIVNQLAESVSINGPQTIFVGQEITLSASVLPTGAIQRVFWSVDDTTIATINTQGRILGLSRGVVTVKATSFDDEQIFATYQIEVDFAQPVSLNINAIQGVLIDQSVQLQAVVSPVTANQQVIWESSDPLIASITPQGLLTGMSSGEVTLTATSADNENVFKTVTIFVTDMVVDRIVIYDGISQMTNQDTTTFKATVYPLEAAQRVVWSVDDTSIATISNEGVLSPVAGATGVVIVKASSLSNPATFNTYSVRIIDHLTPVTFVSNYQELVQAVNGTATLIQLTQNIDASQQVFVPTRTNFSGIFDGKGYSIINLSISGTQADIGLFRRIGGHAVIKDVTFVNPSITSNQINTGLIAGQVNSVGYVTIRNVIAYGLKTTITAGQFTHGGFIGQVTAATTVNIQKSHADYTFQSSMNTGNVGGLIGVVNWDSNAIALISNSIVDMKVNATSAGQIYGGVIGQINRSTSSSIHRVYVSLRNVGTQNALVNGGLIYSQLNTSGNLHQISQIIYASNSGFTRAFANNNGNSQLNGATTSSDLKITKEILETNASTASIFTSGNPVWKYEQDTNRLSFDISHINQLFDEKRASELITQIQLANTQVLTNIELPAMVDGVPIQWTSSNTEVISNMGVVTRQEEDVTVVLTAQIQVGDVIKTKTFEITVLRVVDETEPIEMEIIGPLTLRVGQSQTYTVVVTPENIIKDVTWSVISGQQYVTIGSHGLVQAIAIGTATIRATLAYDPSVVSEFEIEILEAITLSSEMVSDGLAINDPAQSLVSITVNMTGILYYVQSADTLTAAQILLSSSKQSVQIDEAGTQVIQVLIANGNRLHFVLQTNAMEFSNISTLTFDLLATYVLVSNYTELVAALNQNNDINIKLTANIQATGNFTPTKTTRFTGVFDGQGYKITGLNLVSNGNHIGMFREIGGNAIIKNIVFDQPTISVGHFASGLIAGRVSSAGSITITNISVINLVTTVTASQWTHGGIIGTINVNGTTVNMNNIYIDYTIRTTSTSVQTGNVGGLVGTQFNTSTLNVSHVYSDFKVSFANTNNTGQILAAIVGQVNTGTTTNVSYVVAGVSNIGAANAIANAGIVYSQLNNAGSNHQVQSIVVMNGSGTTKLTNNYNTSINGATTASDARITSEFHTTLTSVIADKFITANGIIWTYNTSSNTLEHQGRPS
jgi:hypothetical protein